MSDKGPNCDHDKLVCPFVHWADMEILKLRNGWLAQAERDAREIVRLEMIIRDLQHASTERVIESNDQR